MSNPNETTTQEFEVPHAVPHTCSQWDAARRCVKCGRCFNGWHENPSSNPCPSCGMGVSDWKPEFPVGKEWFCKHKCEVPAHCPIHGKVESGHRCAGNELGTAPAAEPEPVPAPPVGDKVAGEHDAGCCVRQVNSVHDLCGVWCIYCVACFEPQTGSIHVSPAAPASAPQPPELKPCPFCGSMPDVRTRKNSDLIDVFEVRCDAQPCMFIPHITVRLENKEQAIAAWNNRASLPDADRALAADSAAQLTEPISCVCGNDFDWPSNVTDGEHVHCPLCGSQYDARQHFLISKRQVKALQSTSALWSKVRATEEGQKQ